LKDFRQWKVSIMNENNMTKVLEADTKKMHDYEDSDRIYYEPYQFVLKNLAPLMEGIEMTKHKTDDSVYFILC
jgi:hypothetical protein